MSIVKYLGSKFDPYKLTFSLNVKEYIQSKFGINKPDFATSDGWDEWHTDTKAKHPIVYCLTENFPKKAKRIWRKYYVDSKYWVLNRTLEKYHIVSTGLKPGYADCDTRMLHAVFNLLVEHIEIEKGYMQIEPENYSKYPVPWWGKYSLSIRVKRNPQAGIDYLKEELRRADGPDREIYQEIWEIYHWWKRIRPNRPEPSDASGLAVWKEEHPKYREFINVNATPDDVDMQERLRLMNISNQIMIAYDQEDQDMTIRLMKIRKSLWT